MKNRLSLLSENTQDKAIINPKEEYKYERKRGIILKYKYPKSCIICFQSEVINFAMRKFNMKPIEDIFDYKLFELESSGKKIGIMRFGIGAPYSALILERLIARGFKEFIIISTAGCLDTAIKPGTLVLIEKSLRNEGTSFHYTNSKSLFSYADRKLTNKIKNSIRKSEYDFIIGSAWTIDAGYRETLKKATKFRKMGIKAIDMESSALFVISKYRNTKMGCIFSISDSFTKDFKWNPHFHLKEVRQGLKKALDVAVKVFNQ